MSFDLWGGIFILLFCLLISLYKGISFRKIGVKLALVQEKKEDAPDYCCLRGWTACLKKMNISCDVCFFGHSQIADSNFQLYFPDKKVVELGYPGDNLKNMQRRVNQIVAVNPKKIFVLAGTNSLNYSKREFEHYYGELLNAIKDSLPEAQLYCFNIVPQRDGTMGLSQNNNIIRERNSFISLFCKKSNVKMIDIYNLFVDPLGNLQKGVTMDGVHLYEKGYKTWAKALRPYIYSSND